MTYLTFSYKEHKFWCSQSAEIVVQSSEVQKKKIAVWFYQKIESTCCFETLMKSVGYALNPKNVIAYRTNNKE